MCFSSISHTHSAQASLCSAALIWKHNSHSLLANKAAISEAVCAVRSLSWRLWKQSGTLRAKAMAHTVCGRGKKLPWSVSGYKFRGINTLCGCSGSVHECSSVLVCMCTFCTQHRGTDGGNGRQQSLILSDGFPVHHLVNPCTISEHCKRVIPSQDYHHRLLHRTSLSPPV